MAERKSQKKRGKPARDEFTVRGTKIAITQHGEREVLQIDGRIEAFYRMAGGYLLKRDVYQHPAKSLREAVERYLEHEAES